MYRPRLTPLLACLACLFASLPAHSQTGTDAGGLATLEPGTGLQAAVQQMDAVLDAYAAAGQFQGSVLVGEGDQVLYAGARGFANHDWKVPNTKETRFHLASVSKQFTAVAILLFVQEGRIGLETRLEEVLPDYPAEVASQVTVRQLLQHTSGIPNYTAIPGFNEGPSRERYGVDEFVREFCSRPLEFEPGSQFRYSNSGYFLLGAILERLSGTSYENVLRQRIFEPLGMTGSGYARQDRILPNRADGYSELLGRYRPCAFIDMSVPYAAGALYSTVEDLWRWHRALSEGRLLAPEWMEAMYTPGAHNGYGLGWEVGEDFVAHGGGIHGFSTRITRWLDADRCIVVLSNQETGRVMEITRDLAATLDGEAVTGPALDGDSHIAQVVLAEGVEAGLREFETHRRPFGADPLEQSFGSMASYLEDIDAPEDALLLLRFLTAADAEAVAGWDMLGELLAGQGKRDEAVDALVRALELDPDDLERAARVDALVGR